MDLVSLLTTTTSKGNPNAWDISKAYYDAGSENGDLSKAFYTNISKGIALQEGNPTGLFFKPDGSKMYICGSSGDDVNEYDLSIPWLVSSATPLQTFSVSAQETVPAGLFFKPDGTKMYVVGRTGVDINEYDLSTAWDVSSASYVQNFSVSTEEAEPNDIFFKPDGTKMYICGSSGDDVNEYSLSSAWDISTASYVQNFSVSTEELTPTGLSFTSNGAKMYICGDSGDDINEYDLSTAWDISTASYVQNFSVASQNNSPQAIFFLPIGAGFYFVGDSGGTPDTVFQYVIGGFSITAEEATPTDVFFKPDGTKMYVIGTTGDDVNEYSLSSAWDITTASYVQNFSVGAQETQPNGLFFKPDGTKMYVVGITGDDVNEYDLSSAWDISTASYVQVFSVAAQDNQPNGIFFKPDGTKMYISGVSNDDIYEYDLSSAWDVSSASYLQTYGGAGTGLNNENPQSLFFKPDGTKMYVYTTTRFVKEFSLSTPWDISSASPTQNFSVGGQDSAPRGLFFRDDGTQFFLAGQTSDRVFSYKISPI